jgi:DNA-binding NarL/FixJ family response regulator
MSRARLLIADDHALMLDGLRRLLRREFDVLGTFEDGRALLQATLAQNPDVVILDISMPLLNGLDAGAQIHKALPGVRLIFMSMHTEPEFVRDAFRAGASAFVDKRAHGPELIQAVHEVMAGRTYMSPRIKSTLDSLPVNGNGNGNGDGQRREPPVPVLTTRQREVLQLVAEGRSEKEIASELHVCEKTVEFHKASIRRQLSLRSTADMIRYAIKHGLACD